MPCPLGIPPHYKVLYFLDAWAVISDFFFFFCVCFKETFIIWKKLFYSGVKFKTMRVDVVSNQHHQIELTVTFAAGFLKINVLPIRIKLQNVEVKFKSGITANKVRIFRECHKY